MAHNSVVQQAGIVRFLSAGHHFLWKRQKAIDNYFHLNTVNKELAEENMRLRTELFKYQSVFIPPAPLDSTFSCISAEVVHNTTSSHQNFLIINKGSVHGIQPEMGVIGDQGVIGIVQNVYENHSRIISLLSNQIQINTRIEPGGDIGSLAWNGKKIHTATIPDLPQHSQVAVGDTVVTSGFSQIFPARIPLGIVTGTTITQGTFLEAQVSLFQNFNTLRYVYVIRSRHAQEIHNLLVEP
ncbi:MAG: rod shape-determining protein MreC [Bacteroidales bacterium]|nr:rod shape-determining protein MreC [Bacteroidales bacterium]